MSGRRWGRVTVEGWVEEVSGRPGYLIVYPTRDGRVGHTFFYPDSNSELVFLPEPVQFKDGDALRATGGAEVWGRHDGRWFKAFGGRSVWSDEEMVVLLRDGHAVRLVPEANGD